MEYYEMNGKSGREHWTLGMWILPYGQGISRLKICPSVGASIMIK
jgi:hypothetical protein